MITGLDERAHGRGGTGREQHVVFHHQDGAVIGEGGHRVVHLRVRQGKPGESHPLGTREAVQRLAQRAGHLRRVSDVGHHDLRGLVQLGKY
jgi:hypothetical protein